MQSLLRKVMAWVKNKLNFNGASLRDIFHYFCKLLRWTGLSFLCVDSRRSWAFLAKLLLLGGGAVLG